PEYRGDSQAQLVDRRRAPRSFRRNDNDCQPESVCRLCWQLEARWPPDPCSGRSRRMLEKSRLVSCQRTITATLRNAEVRPCRTMRPCPSSFGEKPKSDAGRMKPSSGESETRGIRNDSKGCGLDPMGVAMKECKKPRDHRAYPNRSLHPER